MEEKRILDHLARIERNLAPNSNPFLLNLERNLRKKLRGTSSHEELLWIMKSIAKWIQDRDRNTTYYQALKLIKMAIYQI